jgi:MFS family permease
MPPREDGTGADARTARRALFVLTSVNLLNYVDRWVPSATKSLWQEELGLSDAASALPASAFVFVYLAAGPLAASLDHRWGRVRLIACGVALWSVATATAAFVHGGTALVVSRSLVGVGEAFYATLGTALLSDIFPAARRNRALTLFSLAIPVGSALGYGLGGYVGARLGWRAAFLVCGLPGLLAAAYCARLTDRRVHRSSREEAPSWRVALRVLGSNRAYGLAVAGYAAVTFASGALADWFPTHLVRTGLFDVETAGLIVGGTGVAGGVVGTLAGGVTADRLQGVTRQPLFALAGTTMLLSAAAALLCLAATARLPVVGWLVAAQVLMWAYNGPVNALIVGVVDQALVARAVGLSLLCIHLFGDAVSPTIVGWVSDRTGNLRAALLLVPLAMATGAGVWMWAWRRLPSA